MLLVDSKAHMPIVGNGERPLVKVARHRGNGKTINRIRDVRNTAIMVKDAAGSSGVDSTASRHTGKILIQSASVRRRSAVC
ncbi:hypothetical protein ACNKHK_19510 [Shigella flexneri]